MERPARRGVPAGRAAVDGAQHEPGVPRQPARVDVARDGDRRVSDAAARGGVGARDVLDPLADAPAHPRRGMAVRHVLSARGCGAVRRRVLPREGRRRRAAHVGAVGRAGHHCGRRAAAHHAPLGGDARRRALSLPSHVGTMTTSLRARPEPTEYPSFYHGYIAAVPEGDVVELLRAGGRELLEAIERVPEERGGHRYGPDKWTIREVIGHLIDAERIFTYRALRIARGDQTLLPGFDENEFVKAAGSERRTLADLARELAAVRESTVLLFESFPDEVWARTGNANGKPMSVRALAYVVAGHPMHHLRILRERYGVE